MMLPNRILITAVLLSLLEFFQRTRKLFFLKIIQNPFRANTIGKPKGVGNFAITIGDHMDMIRHDYISKDQYFARFPRFVPRIADDSFDIVRVKNWQAVVRYRSKVKEWIVARNLDH